jgi:hypothetical protein
LPAVPRRTMFRLSSSGNALPCLSHPCLPCQSQCRFAVSLYAVPGPSRPIRVCLAYLSVVSPHVPCPFLFVLVLPGLPHQAPPCRSSFPVPAPSRVASSRLPCPRCTCPGTAMPALPVQSARSMCRRSAPNPASPVQAAPRVASLAILRHSRSCLAVSGPIFGSLSRPALPLLASSSVVITAHSSPGQS